MPSGKIKKEIESFFKELQKVYPLLKEWRLEFVSMTPLGITSGGYCNRRTKTLEIAYGHGMTKLDAKIVTLHEAAHAHTVPLHGPKFTQVYKKMLKRWLGIEKELEIDSLGNYLCVRGKRGVVHY
jgi:hypothetical protein